MKQQKLQKPKIKIKDSQRKITINKKTITDLARQILQLKGIKKAELSILFVGKQRMRALNKEFRNIDQPTDVLAFCMRESKSPLIPGDKRSLSNFTAAKISKDVYPEMLGDVVICPETAKSYAKIYGTSTRKEIHLYLIHGILHLIGYRDYAVKERRLMDKEQSRILNKLNIK